MKEAYIFSGQGSQFSGMGKELFSSNSLARTLFNRANEILGFNISKIMFEGSDEELKQTKVTQPAVFIHSVIAYKCSEFSYPSMVAGHSLGEFSALVCGEVLKFEDALKLVSIRASAMQKACDIGKSTMVAVLGLEDEKVVEACSSIKNNVVVAANFNCPKQVVISGSIEGVEMASVILKNAGAKRCIPLAVSGAFHSPIMKPAEKELEIAIKSTKFNNPICPIYQNINATAEIDKDIIRRNLIMQLTSPVMWRQTIENMVKNGATKFVEFGPGKVLQGLVNKINNTVATVGIS